MRWSTNLRLSVRALIRPWLRTSLSVSSFAVGITSVVILLGAGKGAELALQRALRELGENLLIVRAGRSEAGALRGASRIVESLTPADSDAIAREVPLALRTVPVAERQLPLRAGGRTVAFSVTGTSPGFRIARNFKLESGRFIDDDDLADRRRVAVVGAEVVKELFPGESPLGRRLQVNGAPFTIVGVAREKGLSPDGRNQDQLVIIPLSTAMSRVFRIEHVHFIYIQAGSEGDLPAVVRRAGLILRERHGLAPDAPDDFDIQDQASIVRAQREAGGSFSRMVTGLTILALFLAGAGLLAVSLLSVRERHPEIGLRIAVGGRSRDILLQFLTESVLISVLGAVVGIALGAAGVRAGATLTRWELVLSWESLVYPMAISFLIATLFGSYPAVRAARLDPIVALNGK